MFMKLIAAVIIMVPGGMVLGHFVPIWFPDLTSTLPILAVVAALILIMSFSPGRWRANLSFEERLVLAVVRFGSIAAGMFLYAKYDVLGLIKSFLAAT